MLVVQSIPACTGYLDKAHLERLAAAVLGGEGVSGPVEIGLLLTDDEGIRTLNRQYRSVDAATDVLSFSLLPDADHSFVTPPGQPLQMGDIVISCERAAQQAQEQGHAVRQEIAELLVHGLLHILGYDHDNEADAAAMAQAASAYI